MGYNSESKEEIKDRMIRTALDYWNIKKVENLDPLIRLLIEALAMQLHNISDEIADIEGRVMRRLSEVLLPDAVTVVRPAHAVVHASPQLPELMTNMFDGFSTASPFIGRRDGRNFSFYPVCETKLRRGAVRMIVSENNVYEVLPDQNKRLLLKSQTIPENANRIFVGLEFDEKSIDLSHLSFFFDFPNIDRRHDYLHYLSSAVWRWQGKQLDTSRGLHIEDERQKMNLQRFFDGMNSDQSVNASIVDQYKMSYVTIESQLKVTMQDYTVCPHGFVMPDADGHSSVFCTPLIWLEIDMPPQFATSVLADIQISINTFPVANKEMRRVNRLVKKDFGVIPLTTDDGESFFDMIEVTDENGTVYNRANGYKERNGMIYTMWQGGSETFDRRRTDKDLPYYLYVEPHQSSYFYMRYWTSFGPLANGMRIGQTLNPLGSAYGEYGRALFLTTSDGGKASLSDRERIAKLKYILGCRNRVVTNNDIRNFCFSECCDDISDVIIKKGICSSTESGRGLLRTIDVHLVLKSDGMSEEQKRKLSNDMLGKLIGQSPMTFNYRVFVD